MKILISPAKSINEDVLFPDFNYTFPLFAKEAKSLVVKLKKKEGKPFNGHDACVERHC